jgi:hypothetical protein
VPESYNFLITGVYDHSSQSAGSFANVEFLVEGSDGTLSAESFSDFFTGKFDFSDQEIAFESSAVQELVIELAPPAPTRIPFSVTGLFNAQIPEDIFEYAKINEYAVSATNGTNSAPVIYHNQESVVLVPAISFEGPGLRRVGLLYPRHRPAFRNRLSPSVSNAFGFFTLGDFRVSTGKKFFTGQTYPTSLR